MKMGLLILAVGSLLALSEWLLAIPQGTNEELLLPLTGTLGLAALTVGSEGQRRASPRRPREPALPRWGADQG